MNTRSFVKSLIVSAIAPSILVPVLADRQRWKRLTDPRMIWEFPLQYARDENGIWRGMVGRIDGDGDLMCYGHIDRFGVLRLFDSPPVHLMA